MANYEKAVNAQELNINILGEIFPAVFWTWGSRSEIVVFKQDVCYCKTSISRDQGQAS